MKSTPRVSRAVVAMSAVACVLGILVSAYSYHVETAHEADHSFRALCDISEHMSCTKVFSSRWGRGFGLMPNGSALNQPNSVYGMGYYLIQSSLVFSSSSLGALLQLAFSTMSAIGCIYLGYILFFVLHDFCVVCISMYVINAVIFTCCILKYKAVTSAPAGKTPDKKRN